LRFRRTETERHTSGGRDGGRRKQEATAVEHHCVSRKAGMRNMLDFRRFGVKNDSGKLFSSSFAVARNW
jgi:hypothetical protein